MACVGCAERRKALKKFVKTVFKGDDKTVQVSGNRAITKKYVDRINAKFRKK